jgi:squalene-hopene/tetraprenyl-beta-curcumene cyclase
MAMPCPALATACPTWPVARGQFPAAPACRVAARGVLLSGARANAYFPMEGDLPMSASLRRLGFVILVGALCAAVPARAADDLGVSAKENKAVVEKGYAFLKKSQKSDGSFGDRPEQAPGITALVVAALLHSGYAPDDPVVGNALGYLEGQVKKDGGIYNRGLANYVTSVAVMALNDANRGGKYDTVLRNATKFLKGLQFSDDEKDVKYGGVGYGNPGGKDRPDLSNTQLFLDALLSAGVPKDDPAVQRALKFISRCQNLPGESNDQAFAKKTSEEDRGGLVYVPDADDKPHQTPEGGLRSLGGMTYAGLKSFLYAGVGKDDPRVKGAINWIRRHYTLKENPGMGSSGLYYYYHTFAKAMTAWGDDRFEDAQGTKHDWRRELFDELKRRQRNDGSWVNERRDQYGEGNPDLATAFALLALSYTKK